MGAFRRRWPGLSYGRGEDWHYVGEAGEPAFENSWANLGGGGTKMAFRIREAGVVDLAGIIDASAASGTVIFTLPVGYRPSEKTPGFAVLIHPSTADLLRVSTSGAVELNTLPTSSVYISGQFFLVPPGTAP